METSEHGEIRIVTILGSARPGNYTGRALALVHDELGRQDNVSFESFDPRTVDLRSPGLGSESSGMGPWKERVEQAAGVILATPEYHGSFSSVTKLVIESLGFPSVLAGKPIALLGVAAGQIGAIKSLEHLRSVCSHVGAVVLPGPVSVAGVRRLFDDEGRCLDEKIEKRIRGVATSLVDYLRQSVCPRLALEAMVREDS